MWLDGSKVNTESRVTESGTFTSGRHAPRRSLRRLGALCQAQESWISLIFAPFFFSLNNSNVVAQNLSPAEGAVYSCRRLYITAALLKEVHPSLPKYIFSLCLTPFSCGFTCVIFAQLLGIVPCPLLPREDFKKKKKGVELVQFQFQMIKKNIVFSTCPLHTCG